jgi:anti-anti-sigma regulatory factor
MGEFKYVIGEKDDLIIVLFYGDLSHRGVTQIEELEFLLKEKPNSFILLNFRDLNTMTPAVHIAFTKLQKTLRDSKKYIALCGIKPDIKHLLSVAGIIREAEVFNNIPDAWKTLTARAHNDAANAAALASRKKAA